MSDREIGPLSSSVPSISMVTICSAGSASSRWARVSWRHHVHGLGDQEIARVWLLQDLGQQIADLMHLREPFEHRHKLAVLPLGDLEIDDVVVEVVLPIARRHRLELAARGMNQDGLQLPDLRGDLNGHTTSYSGERSLG